MGFAAAAWLGALLAIGNGLWSALAHRPKDSECGADGKHGICSKGSLEAKSYRTKLNRSHSVPGSQPKDNDDPDMHEKDKDNPDAKVKDKGDAKNEGKEKQKADDLPEDCKTLAATDNVNIVDRKKVLSMYPSQLCRFEETILDHLKEPVLQGATEVSDRCPVEDALYAGYGCAFFPEHRDDMVVKDKSYPACQCLKSQFQSCWSPSVDDFLAQHEKGDDESTVEVGKALLVGKCTTPIYAYIILAVLATCLVICFIAPCFRKPRSKDGQKDPRLAGSSRDPNKAANGNQGS